MNLLGLIFLGILIGGGFVSLFFYFYRVRPSHSILHAKIIEKIEKDIGSSHSLEDRLLKLYYHLSDLAKIDSYYVAFCDFENDTIFYPIFIDGDQQNIYPMIENMNVRLSTGQGFSNYIIKRSKTLLIPDTFDITDPEIPAPPHLGGKPTRTYLGVPLILQDQVIGVLSVQSYQARAFSTDFISLIEAIAQRLAYALENSRLVEDLSTKLAELDTIRLSASMIASSLDITQVIDQILKELGKVIPNDCAVIQWTDGLVNTEVAIRGECGDPAENFLDETQRALVQEVSSSAQAKFINASSYEMDILPKNTDDSEYALLAVPLTVQGRTLGVLLLIKKYVFGKRWGFTQHHLELTQVFADQVSIAVNNALLFKDVENLAITDPLVNIFNRRHFLEVAEAELKNAQKDDSPFSLILFDLDYFKKINDTHGHLVGDQILIDVVKLCENNIRDYDIIGRYGGEEFIIMLPKGNLQIATNRAESLRSLLEQTVFETENGPIQMTASFGIAGWQSNQNGDTQLTTLIADADRVLYQSKSNGRNRVTVSQ